IFLVGAVSFSVIITWAFNHTKASLLIAILIHQCINFSQGLTTTILPGAKNNEVGPVFVVALAALIIVLATRGRLGYPRPAERLQRPGASLVFCLAGLGCARRAGFGRRVLRAPDRFSGCMEHARTCPSMAGPDRHRACIWRGLFRPRFVDQIHRADQRTPWR